MSQGHEIASCLCLNANTIPSIFLIYADVSNAAGSWSGFVYSCTSS